MHSKVVLFHPLLFAMLGVLGCDSNNVAQNPPGTESQTVQNVADIESQTTDELEPPNNAKVPDLEESSSQRLKNSPVNNQEVGQDLATRLSKSRFRGYDITLMFKDGTVELTGHVTSAEQFERATAIVKQNEHVKTVINRLEIRSRGKQPTSDGRKR